MRHLSKALLLVVGIVMFGSVGWGQVYPPSQPIVSIGPVPSGACSPDGIQRNTLTGVIYTCASGTWAIQGGGGTSGFPITLGSTSIAGGATVTTVAGLTLTGVPALTIAGGGSLTLSGVTDGCASFSSGVLSSVGSPCGTAQLYPGAGIAVSTGSAWGTSLTAPTGAIVGTTDTQTLTNKSIDATEINSGTLSASRSWALGGDVNSSAGSSTVAVTKVNGGSIPVSQGLVGTNPSGQFITGVLPGTVVQTGQANTYTSGLQSFATVPLIPEIGASNPATCTVGQVFINTTSTPGQNWWFCLTTNTWTQQLNSGGTGGTVTNFSASGLSPLFTASVANATTTPALSFALSNAGANTVFGNPSGSTGAPSFYTPVFNAGSGISITGSFGTGGLTISNTGSLSNPMTTAGDMIGATTGGTPARIAGNVSTTPGMLVQSGNGTTPGLPAWFLNTSINLGESVLLHGATGNCSTDDTSAINAVMANYSNVFFPPTPGSCYKISSQLLGKTGQTVIGSGSASKIEQFSTTANGLAFLASSSGARNIRVFNMYLQDQVRGTRTAGHGIDIDGTTDASIFELRGNYVYGFENGENLVASLNSFVLGDRSDSALNVSFNLVGATTGTGNSTSTSLYSTYADAPASDCYAIGNVQYSALIGTAADNCGRDGYHLFAESGGRPKSITFVSPGNETSARYNFYSEGQSIRLIEPAFSGTPTTGTTACVAINQGVQTSIIGGQCTGGAYAISQIANPTFLPDAYQGTNRVEDFYASGQGTGFLNDPSGYWNVSMSRKNYAGAVPVTQLHEVTTPMQLANVLTITGQLDHQYQSFTYTGGGRYNTSANETGTTLTFTLNACANSTCSSGRVILAQWTTGTVGATGNPYANTWNTDATCQVQTVGSSGTIVCHGTTTVALTSGGAPVVYNDSNTSAVTINTPSQFYIGMMVQKSSILDTSITQDVNNLAFALF